MAAAPAGRRYLAGWAMASELHILNDEYTDRRAADRTAVIYARVDPLKGVPGCESWWDVPVSEVSALASTRARTLCS